VAGINKKERKKEKHDMMRNVISFKEILKMDAERAKNFVLTFQTASIL
jgi:hypothetical protein